MFELNEIMRQRESRVFAKILNRLREGNPTDHEILKIKESSMTIAPHLLMFHVFLHKTIK